MQYLDENQEFAYRFNRQTTNCNETKNFIVKFCRMVPCTACSVEKEILGNIIIYVRVIVGSMIFFSFPPCKSFYLCKAFKYRLSLCVHRHSFMCCLYVVFHLYQYNVNFVFQQIFFCCSGGLIDVNKSEASNGCFLCCLSSWGRDNMFVSECREPSILRLES